MNARSTQKSVSRRPSTMHAGRMSLNTRLSPQALPVPEEELFFQFSQESHFKSTWIQVSRTVVTLQWNIGTSRVFNTQQKAAIVSSLRRLVNSQGQLTLKTARYDDVAQNIDDLKSKLYSLILASLSATKTGRFPIE